ncbi:MAG: HAD hydrolase family protein [Lentisphaeria bacterium]
MNLTDKLRKIRVVILDVDGTLTDNGVLYGFDNDTAGKRYSTFDGLGIDCLRKGGLKVGLLTGRNDFANHRRARDCKFDFIKDTVPNKKIGFLELLDELDVDADECLYMGDDLNDLPAIRRAGVSVAPGNSAKEVKQAVTIIVESCGGHGAVREMAEILLKAQGKWLDIVKSYDF